MLLKILLYANIYAKIKYYNEAISAQNFKNFNFSKYGKSLKNFNFQYQQICISFTFF